MNTFRLNHVLYKSVTIILHLFAAIIGIICLSVLPYLFDGLSLDFVGYFTELKTTVYKLLFIKDLTYQETFRDWPILPHVFKYYTASMKIFLSSFVLSIMLAFFIVYILLFVKEKWYRRTKYVFVLFESLPDLLVIICLQQAVIWFFKKTDYLLFEIASYGDTDSFGLPVICLGFSTTFLFVRLLLNQIEEERKKNYVDFVQSKGFGRLYVLNRHMLPNIFFTLFQYSKTIVLFMLTGLFLIEFLFNINGLFSFVKTAMTPEIITIALIYLYLPFFILFKIFDLAVPQIWKGEEER